MYNPDVSDGNEEGRGEQTPRTFHACRICELTPTTRGEQQRWRRRVSSRPSVYPSTPNFGRFLSAEPCDVAPRRERATIVSLRLARSYVSSLRSLSPPPYMHARLSPPLSLAYSSAEYKLPTATREKHVHGPSALSATRTTRQYMRHALKPNPFAPFFSLQAVAVRAAIGALRWSLTLLECAPQCAQPRQVNRARVLAFLGFFLSSYFANRENRGRQENTGARAERARSRFNSLHQRTEIPRSPLPIFFSVLPPPSTPLLHHNSSRQGCTTLMAPLDESTVKFAARQEEYDNQ